MKRSVSILIFFSFLFITIYALAQNNSEIKAQRLIELTGTDGAILVFPSPTSGPNGPIIRFVVNGVNTIPKVTIETKNGYFPAIVTTVDFREGYIYFGWFEVPREEIIRISINDTIIPWGNDQ